MVHIIPAQVIIDPDGDEPPRLVVSEGSEDLGDLISERGIEIEQEPVYLIGEGPGLDPDNHGPAPAEALVNEPEPKPRSGFQACMSEELRRPLETERLTQSENRHRFRKAVLVCRKGQKEGDQRNN